MTEIRIAEHFLKYFPSAGCIDAPKNFAWKESDVEHARFVTDAFIKNTDGALQVAWLLEPFSLHPEDYLSAMNKHFDAVLTHNRYFAEQFDWLWYPKGGSWIELSNWYVNPKSNDVSLLLSQKTSLKGQKFRHEIRKNFSDKLDIFGLEKWIHPSDPLGHYRYYRYSIVVENEKSAGWFTERLIDCFAVGTIPIYWGCPGIENLFNPAGMILINALDDVPEALELASKKHYRSCQKAIAENLELAKQYRVAEDWIFETYPFLFK